MDRHGRTQRSVAATRLKFGVAVLGEGGCFVFAKQTTAGSNDFFEKMTEVSRE